VKEDTRIFIHKLAREMGYIPNNIAKSLRLGKTKTIGVISADSSNPFFAAVILGIENAAREHNYHILLVNTEEKIENEREAIHIFIERQVDGLLLMPISGEQSNIEYIKSLPIPFLLVGRWLPGLEDHSVMSDDYEKAKEITSIFIENGHKDILHLAGPSFVSSSADRVAGYRDALIAANLPIKEDLIIETNGHIEDGYRQINSLIRNEISFTAIFAFNDLVALGALRAIKEAGFLVPKDIQVMGFDDLEYSHYLYPSLSSVCIPKRQLGRLAFEKLYEHLQNINLDYQKLMLESRIILRETTSFKEP